MKVDGSKSKRGYLIRPLCVVGIILWIVGFLAWMLGVAVSSGNAPFVTSTTEMPLGDVRSVAVDSKGRIYCGLAFYRRIQQYNSNGVFQRVGPLVRLKERSGYG